jgi:hypothetical protein
MKRTLALALLAAFGACNQPDTFVSEGYSGYYRHPNEEDSPPRRIERKEIVYWAANPKDKKRIGFLNKYETEIKGSRDSRECYYITDIAGKSIGFITSEGAFYRFNDQGRLQDRPIGEWKIVVTGLKAFYNIPHNENVDLEDVDPYR